MTTHRRLRLACLAATICLQWLLLPAGTALAERGPREHETREHDAAEHEEREHESGEREDHEGHDGPDDRGERESGDDHSGRSGSSGESGRDQVSDKDARRQGPRFEVERDARGRERVRGEVLIACQDRDIVRVRDAGFTILESRVLGSLGESVARVRVPAGETIEKISARLQLLVPAASISANHLYRTSAATMTTPPPALTTASPARVRIGIIDTGIEPATARLRDALLVTRGFAGEYVPRAHGTLVGDIAARGGAGLVSADVFGTDSHDQPASPTLAVAGALDWLLTEKLRVINVSIEGPDNPLLARMIRRVLDADIAIVAAAGNGGPRAPPAFPAAYPGVIAVTAVDASGRVYRRANRGTYVMFAARGVDVSMSPEARGAARESGTSFAAPLVAAVLARRLEHQPATGTQAIVEGLRLAARDLGTPGRDEVFGWGEIVSDGS